ncbi:MAG: glycerophosphoryl diester phosphodiesterase [Thermoleophilia bacterium]|nr:glycerophosphoryl diester phosphodiesterase [Thermoleophilia bacterium]
MSTPPAASAPSAATRVVAHRGFHGVDGPVENTLGAFTRAIDAGADAIELDVRRTRDGVLAVHHDAQLPGSGGVIAQLDHAQLPRHADGQAVPTLGEAAELARSRDVGMVIELKDSGLAQAAVDALRGRIPFDDVEVISFSPDTVRAVEALEPGIRTGFIAPHLPSWLQQTPLYAGAMWAIDALGQRPALDAAARAGADYVSVERRMATPGFLAEAQRRNVPVTVWTVNDEADMRRLTDAGVYGIVTDDTALARRIRDEKHVDAPPEGEASTVNS